MNIQISGTKKCFDTKKAQRYFKERNIKFQFIDLKEKGMSRGELRNIMQAVGSAEAVLNENPIVRNGKLATAGYQPDEWRCWN